MKVARDTAFCNAKPKAKPYKLADAGGLFLLVRPVGPKSPAGSKLWRLKYRHAGREKLLALGSYPEVSLAEARRLRDEARADLAAGRDPSIERQARRTADRQRSRDTFEAVAREWLEHWRVGKAGSTIADVTARVERELLPALGALPVAEVSARYAGAILRYAIQEGHAERNPVPDLRERLTPPAAEHYARVESRDLPALLRAIDTYAGTPWVRAAMRLMPLTFVRTAKLIGAELSEFDTAAALWRIPAERTKMRRAHLVPLSRQALAILEELRPVTGHRAHVFPGERDPRRPMSNGAILMALRRLGYAGTQTGHGFRGIASTLLHEAGHPHAVIEAQLAHVERSDVSRAYNAAEYLPQRVAMMQAWADELDRLREGATVIELWSRAAA